MYKLERWIVKLRRSQWLRNMDWLWDLLRPCYEGSLAIAYMTEVERVLNGKEHILLLSRFRGISDEYEPQVWNRLMADVRPGDVVVDVGAYIGLYTVPLARRVGSRGKVIAFEPDPDNFATLREHVEINGVSAQVSIVCAAAGDVDGSVSFHVTKDSQSHVSDPTEGRTTVVDSITLDTLFADERVDILKIDVEGYEEKVLQGALRLLGDPDRGPRAVYVEVHPYAWMTAGTSSRSLLSLLAECDYRVLSLNGQPVSEIHEWGEIVAYKGDR